jgi:hypothetical protein
LYKKITYKEKGQGYLELIDEYSHSKARICLDFGGSLEELTLNDIKVIEDMSPLAYENT